MGASIVVAIVLVIVVLVFGLLALLAKFYQTVAQGQAMIVNTMRAEPEVSFTGKIVIPILNRKEVMDISLKTIEIDRFGKEGLICKDNIRADIKVKFFVRVNKSVDDVLRVAQAIGCERASHQETLDNLFSAKFSEALKTVGKSMVEGGPKGGTTVVGLAVGLKEGTGEGLALGLDGLAVGADVGETGFVGGGGGVGKAGL